MNRFEYHVARSVDDAQEAFRTARSAAYKAGGTDLLDELKSFLRAPERVVTLHRVEGLDGIEVRDGAVRLGALVTLARLAEDETVRRVLPALARAAEEAATPQVRNLGTVGGNLCQRPRCWYFRHPDLTCRKKGGSVCLASEGENEFHAILGNGLCAAVHPSSLAVPLVAYRATVVTTGREIPIGEFFVAPERDVTRENVLEAGEVIREVVVPQPPEGSVSAYYEIRHKDSFDWALVSAAVAGTVGGALRVALGMVAPVPWAVDVERAADADAVVAAVSRQRWEPLAKNAYKVALVETCVRRALARATEGR